MLNAADQMVDFAGDLKRFLASSPALTISSELCQRSVDLGAGLRHLAVIE